MDQRLKAIVPWNEPPKQKIKKEKEVINEISCNHGNDSTDGSE